MEEKHQHRLSGRSALGVATICVATAFSPSFGAVSYRPAPEGIPGVVLVTADADDEPRFDCVG